MGRRKRGLCMCISCSYYDVTELEDPTRMSWALEQLPWPDRRKKALRFRFAVDQCLCVGAGLLAAQMLRERGVDDLTLGFAEYGKPYLLHYPSVHFDISHSGNLAVCAVADEPVGVDAEVTCDHGDAVARYCLQPAELDWLARSPDRPYAFTQLWVRKESYIKLTGTGLSVEPRSFSVLPGDPPEDNVSFAEFAIRDTLVCVCTYDKRKVRLTPWSP